MFGDAFSGSRALVNNVQRGPSLSKHINVEPSKQQPPKNIQYLSKSSNHSTKVGHLAPGGGTPSREQPVNGDGRPTSSEGTPTVAVTSIQGDTSNQKRTIMEMNNTGQGNSMGPKTNVVHPMTHNEVTKIAEKVLKKNPDSIRKYARGEKKALTFCYLAGMVLNACNYKADPQMIDQVLHERLQHVNIVETKGNTSQHRI